MSDKKDTIATTDKYRRGSMPDGLSSWDWINLILAGKFPYRWEWIFLLGPQTPLQTMDQYRPMLLVNAKSSSRAYPFGHWQLWIHWFTSLTIVDHKNIKLWKIKLKIETDQKWWKYRPIPTEKKWKYRPIPTDTDQKMWKYRPIPTNTDKYRWSV